jgi:hypothetical protein
VESASRHTPSRWLVVVLRFVVLGTATAFAVLATILGGIAQNRVPGDARWTSIGTYPEFWIALVSGLMAAGLLTSSSVLARWFGSAVQRRSTTERDRALVMAYLRARINAWNTPDWGLEVPSDVERRLTVTTVAERDDSTPQTFTEEAALGGRHMLVVLGGPGTGKTWLARRYARQAAEAALGLLDRGAALSEIELPVYTTWDHWAQLADAGGDGVRAGLVASSFGADVHHGGGETAETVAALKEVLNRDQTRVLFVIDSLDEATSKDHATRLGNLTGLAGPRSRVVITSRPGAWGRVHNRMPVLDDSRLVVELRDLSYPEDVEAFVGAWFAHDPERARSMTDQLRTRHDVARAAVVPLIITFYCLVAADGAPSAPLPARRHDLYERIIAQSLARANKSAGADPDYRYAERISQLRQWAWRAVGTSNTPAGLGDWGETFVPLTPPTVEDHLALDALAPRVGVTRERTVRRFQHRTILEHLIGEHLATLDTDEAAEILVPHLWFDPDWEVAAPAALAAHNRAHLGALLDRVLHVMNPLDPDADRTQQEAQRELARVLLRAAADSEPGEWRAEHQELIGALRIDSLGWDSRLATRTAHWPSPSGLVDEALNKISVAKDWYVASELAEALAILTISDRERDRAVTAVLERLAGPGENYQAASLAGTLPGLVASAWDRERASTVVLERIAAVDRSHGVGNLVEALRGLLAGDRERAIAVVLERMTTTDSEYVAAELVEALPGLIVSVQDRERAITAGLRRIAAADVPIAARLVEALPGLVVSVQDRERAITVVLERIAGSDSDFDVLRLVEALPGLTVSDRDCERVFAVVLDRIAVSADGLTAGYLAKALPGLIVSEGDRKRAFDVVFDWIVDADVESFGYFTVDGMAEALSGLITSDDDRDRAVAVLLDRLTGTELGSMVDGLAQAFTELEPSDVDRERALAVMLDRLAAVDKDYVAADLAEALPGLVTVGYRGRATHTILDRLTAADDEFSVSRMAEAFTALEPSAVDRERAVTAVLNSLATAEDSFVAGHLVEVLPELVVSEGVRERALTAVLDRLATDNDAAVRLAEALLKLIISDCDRERALSVVLDQLAANDGAASSLLADAARDLIRGLPGVLDTLRRHTTLTGRPLPPPLVSRVRAFLACSDWLSLLHEAPRA